MNLTKDVRKPQTTGCMTFNPVSLPVSAVCTGAVLHLWENMQLFPSDSACRVPTHNNQ